MLLRPVERPALTEDSDRGVARLLVAYDRALGRANGQINSIGQIVGAQ